MLLYKSKESMETTNIYNGLNYTVAEINRNYKIKVSGVNFEGDKIHKLLGVSGLINLIGIELTNKLVDRAFDCTEDKCECKLRRGLKVTFYIF